MFADLHCHTRMSDGSIGISDAVSIAKKLNVKVFSITDHDTFAGSVRADLLGQKVGIEVLLGAEISAMDYKRKRKVHILCYLPKRPERLTTLFHDMAKKRQKAASVMLRKVMRKYPISPQMVSFRAKESTSVFKAHIMHALMDAGYTDTIYGDLSKKLFYPKIGLASVPIEYPDVFDVVEKVHEAQGISVLAHPRTYDSFDLLPELVSAVDLDGVEIYHPDHDEADIERLLKMAKELHLLITGGSDFHGMYSSRSNIFASHGVEENHVFALKEYARSKFA